MAFSETNYLKYRLSQIYKNEGGIATLGALFYLAFYGKAWTEVLNKKTPQERFHQIYKNNVWGSKESRSGPGSTKKHTELLRGWMITRLPTSLVSQR